MGCTFQLASSSLCGIYKHWFSNNPKKTVYVQQVSSPKKWNQQNKFQNYLQKTKGALCSRKSLRQDQERIAIEVEAYRNVLGANASIAQHSGVTLFSTRIEARVYALFSAPRPRVLEQNGIERQSTKDISWLDLMYESLTTTEFHQTPGGDYVCCFGDLVVDMPETDRNGSGGYSNRKIVEKILDERSGFVISRLSPTKGSRKEKGSDSR